VEAGPALPWTAGEPEDENTHREFRLAEYLEGKTKVG
jgi:hypothetical protein